MSDRGNLVLQPTEGKRAPASVGERVMVGGAGLALVAGLLIAVVNIVGADREPGSAAASSTPSASDEPSPTPRPSRTPRPLAEFTLEPGEPPEPSPPSAPFSGWIRAATDLVIRSAPAVDAFEVGTLAAGGVAFVDGVSANDMLDQPDDLGWLHLVEPRSGWVATAEGGTQLVQRYSAQPGRWSGEIWSVVAGREGFIATGSPPRGEDEYPGLLAAASADGASWRMVPELGQLGFWTVAWGPSGWLAVTPGGPDGTQAWVWRSSDGVSWSALGSPREVGGWSLPDQMAGSDRGYVLTTNAGRPRPTFWFSSDGMTWRESAGPEIGRDGWVRVVGTSHGFYAWDDRPTAEDAERAAFSVDGRNWSGVAGAPDGANVQIVETSEGLLGTWQDRESGLAIAWAGTVEGNRLTWRQDPEATEAFSGAVVSALAADGHKAIAFGWDRATEERIAWTADGSGWTRSPMPAEFGGIPRVAAGGPAGVVVVASRPTLRGSNPVFWHLADDGSWSPEPSPLMPLIPDPSTAECGAPPQDGLELVAIDRALAVACFGDATHTVRAWSEPCQGCYGGFGSPESGGSAEPAWLVSPTVNQLFLSPIESSEGWSLFTAVTHPSVGYAGGLGDRWVELTGHFDDPASATCRLMPGPEELLFYGGAQQTIDACRMQFVVTAVSEVPGP